MSSEAGATPTDGSATPDSVTELDEPELPYAGFTWMEVGIIVGVCLLFAVIAFINNLTQPPCCAPSTQAEILRETSSLLSYLVLWALSALPVFWACVRLKPNSVGWGPVLAGHGALALTIPSGVEWSHTAIQAGLYMLWPPADGDFPDFALSPTSVLTELEFLTELIPYLALLIIGLIREGYLRSQARHEQAEQLEREAEQLRSQLTEARLESLRMQINPHFFHNTLHTISTMAGRDPEGVRRATTRLSDLMRYVLSTSDQQEVTLDEELDVLESYLDIQKLRLDDRLDVTFDIDPEARPALVPTLLLQPLAENAVKHGFEGTDETGHLQIRAAREGEALVLEVADDGQGLSDAPVGPAEMGDGAALRNEEDSHGLDNIVERLDGLYGDAASLQFERSSEGGLRVVVRLPFRTREPDRSLRASGVVAD